MADLNEKQKKFCEAFSKCLNGTQAAIEAGYAKGSARSQGSTLLADPNVSKHLKGIMKRRREKLEISGDRVVQRLADIAFGHLGLVCCWSDQGGLELKDSTELSDQEQAIIQEINVKPISDGDGGLLGYDKKVKMKDSLKALEMLCKYLGILDGSGKINDTDTSSLKDRLLSVFAKPHG